MRPQIQNGTACATLRDIEDEHEGAQLVENQLGHVGAYMERSKWAQIS